jgi:cytochrome c oxidase assembly protein subunit 15
MTEYTSLPHVAMPSPDRSRERPGAVRAWLLLVAMLVLAMAVVGAATRLTDSGLSITEWQPLLGAIPPLSDADWQAAFEKYRAIPEYQLVNKGMSLEAFQAIYWWEWAHRQLGRVIGVVYAVPLLVFWARGAVPRGLAPRLLGLLALGGLQGFVGWYMVQSGLSERVDVSQYRLAMHLGLAVAIFAAAWWLALGIGRRQALGAGSGLGWSAGFVAAAIYLQILLGAFVAGLDAGMAYNTWPLMDGAFVPEGLLAMTPWWLNLFESALTVQFQHRMMAYLVAILVAVHVVRAAARPLQAEARLSLGALVLGVAAQIGLGIWTLVAQVPIGLGLAHQAGALLLLAVALWHLAALTRTPVRAPASA